MRLYICGEVRAFRGTRPLLDTDASTRTTAARNSVVATASNTVSTSTAADPGTVSRGLRHCVQESTKALFDHVHRLAKRRVSASLHEQIREGRVLLVESVLQGRLADDVPRVEVRAVMEQQRCELDTHVRLVLDVDEKMKGRVSVFVAEEDASPWVFQQCTNSSREALVASEVQGRKRVLATLAYVRSCSEESFYDCCLRALVDLRDARYVSSAGNELNDLGGRGCADGEVQRRLSILRGTIDSTLR